MRKWLKEARVSAGFSLKSLSTIIGVTWQALSYYENGQRRPSPEVAKKIGTALNIDWTRFFDEKDNDNESGEDVEKAV